VTPPKLADTVAVVAEVTLCVEMVKYGEDVAPAGIRIDAGTETPG
jgi:hypothetical protein